MANTLSSIGTKLFRVADPAASPIPATEELGNVMDISGPSFSRGTIDTTSHSTPNSYKTYIVERWDPGELTFDLQFDPLDTVHSLMIGDLTTSVAADDPDDYILRFPNAKAQAGFATITFKGFLTSFDISEPVEGISMASVTIKASGAPTYNANDTRSVS